MKKSILFALMAVLTIMLVACGKQASPNEQYKRVETSRSTNSISNIIAETDSTPNNTTDSIEVYEDGKEPPTGEAAENISKLMLAIINGDADALAEVMSFPIYRRYPAKDIENAQELKKLFNILFDDSIKNVLKYATINDWDMVGWRGYMLYNGVYLWATEIGTLHYINYESSKYKTYIKQLKKEERQKLDESDLWVTIDCLVAIDSTVFLRLEEWDNAQRLHVFTHDENRNTQHMVFNGIMETQGSCQNDCYWYACSEGLIDVWIESPSCNMYEIKYGAYFPNDYHLPECLRGKTIPMRRARWREVKKWWRR